MSSRIGYLYVNDANRWSKFASHLHAIHIDGDDGSLKLDFPLGGGPSRGALMGGPFTVGDIDTDWYRLRIDVSALETQDHIRFYTQTTTNPDTPIPLNLASDNPFSTGWIASPGNELDVLIHADPDAFLWIGAIVESEGNSDLAINQMRIDYGRDTYSKHLPVIYRHDEGHLDFLNRYMSLHESVLGGLENTIDDLSKLFAPSAAPDGVYASWFSWLADWLDFTLNEAWSEPQARKYLDDAFQLYAIRGTVAGLRQYLKWYAGVDAHIEEPLQHAELWSLGENSTLGFTTYLGQYQPEGASLGSTATINDPVVGESSSNIPSIFSDLAHHFCVRVYCADLVRPNVLQDAIAVLEREKLAHTTYELCVIEPGMRIGAQSMLGVDAIISAGPVQFTLGNVMDSVVLASESSECQGQSNQNDTLFNAREDGD